MSAENEEFYKFVIENKDKIDRIMEILALPLDENPVLLTNQLRVCESHYGNVTYLASYAHSFLDSKISDSWRIADGKNSQEREAKVKYLTCNEKRLTILLDGLCKTISQRISLGQSLLRFSEKELATKHQF